MGGNKTSPLLLALKNYILLSPRHGKLVEIFLSLDFYDYKSKGLVH